MYILSLLTHPSLFTLSSVCLTLKPKNVRKYMYICYDP